jgi:hypothetical protein
MVSPPRTQTDSDRIISILHRTLETDAADHERRAVLLNSATLFMPQKNPSVPPEQMSLFLAVLLSVFSTPPPFSIITKSYRQIYFHPREHPDDVTVSYKILKMLVPLNPPLQPPVLHALVRRLTSASTEDRNGAKAALTCVNIQHAPLLIHLLALTLIPPPPHGTSTLLETVVHLLKTYRPPPPLFDDFFVTTSLDDRDQLLSIAGLINEPKLNDGITIFEELSCTFRILHFAPHYQTFTSQLIEALCSLHAHNDEYAHQNRRFLLNHWPRNDPPKAVLFMREATAICVNGPPPEEYVWQRLSWRSVSIHWQIAMEGLNFVQQTIQRAEGFDHSVLLHLIDEAIAHHWNQTVRTKAEAVRDLLPQDMQGSPPKSLPTETWNRLMELAQHRYPGDAFQAPAKGRRKQSRK